MREMNLKKSLIKWKARFLSEDKLILLLVNYKCKAIFKENPAVFLIAIFLSL